MREEGQRTQAILGGELDVTHQAVVAVRQLRDAESLCSGVVFAIDQTSRLASVLTAAHCLGGSLPSLIAVGTDYTAPATLRFVPVDAAVHPQFRSDDDESPFDVAVLRITGDVSQLRTIELAAPAEALRAGEAVVAVGYGLSTLDGGTLPQRRSVELVVSRVDDEGVIVDQKGGAGICSGDSGGPLLVRDSRGVERVAAVHSRLIPASVDVPPCLGESVSWPVASVSGFLRAAASAPAPSACTACRVGAESEGGSCLALRRACEQRDSCAAPLSCMNRCATRLCTQQCKQSAAIEELEALDAIDSCPCVVCTESCPLTDACDPPPRRPDVPEAGLPDAAPIAPEGEPTSPPEFSGGGCATGRRDASLQSGGYVLLLLCLSRRGRKRNRLGWH